MADNLQRSQSNLLLTSAVRHMSLYDEGLDSTKYLDDPG